MAIKINKNLIQYSNFDPTKESKPVALRDLCNEIEEKKIVLPIFQTYIRWTPEKSVSLLNFQLNGKAAVSPISINRIENKELAVPQICFLTREIIKQDELVGKQSVNDGQQRLSCNYKAYIDHEDFKSIVLDITAGKFLLNPEGIKKSQIPVGKLYNKEDSVFAEYIAKHKELQPLEIQMLLTKIRSKFMGYYYTVNYAKDLTQDEQLKWFDVLNLAGSRVTGVEVHLTNMLVKGIDFYKEYSNKFLEKLTTASLDHLFVREDTKVSIPLATLNSAYEVLKNKPHTSNYSPIPSDVKALPISNLKNNEIEIIFDMTLTALDKAISFIYNNDLDPKRIDYLTYITGFFVYNKNQEVNNKQRNELIEWFNSVEFTDKGNRERREIFDYVISIKDSK
ncbi:hypothetical protein [Clostridium perfringens]|uniref:hypothetical protein n=1 Tax=Clostridium perfringens TaxID=1502 RepID=UPI003A100F4F